MDYSMMQITGHPKAVISKPGRMPNAFSEKIKLWRKLFETEPLVAHHRNLGLRFCNEAKALADRRHEIIHGVIHHFDRSIQGASALRLKHLPGKTTARMFELRTVELNNLLEDVAGLYHQLSVIAMTALFLSLSPGGVQLVSRKPNGVQILRIGPGTVETSDEVA
jgi:hypothetical protein